VQIITEPNISTPSINLEKVTTDHIIYAAVLYTNKSCIFKLHRRDSGKFIWIDLDDPTQLPSNSSYVPFSSIEKAVKSFEKEKRDLDFGNKENSHFEAFKLNDPNILGTMLKIRDDL
jgi:hypothetical protein